LDDNLNMIKIEFNNFNDSYSGGYIKLLLRYSYDTKF